MAADSAPATPATYSARDAKSHLGQLIDEAQQHPVAIERYGRRIAYIVSRHHFDEMAACAKRAQDSVEQAIGVPKKPPTSDTTGA